MASDGRRKVNGFVKLILSLFFFAGSYIVGQLLRLTGRKPAPTCIVLYYHSVPAEQRYAFARHMDVVTRLTQPIRVDQVPEMAPGEHYSGITFDDAFENVFDNALPELIQRGIPGAIFVTTDVLGKYATWWPEAAPERHERIAPESKVRAFSNQLIVFGSHALTHPRLTLTNETDAKREIIESKRQLEALLGSEVRIFSFPFGACNDALVDWCREAGYERVFTSLPTRAFENPKEFVVGRVKAEPTDWRIETYLKLMGAYRWIPQAIAMKQKLFAKPRTDNPRIAAPDASKSIA